MSCQVVLLGEPGAQCDYRDAVVRGARLVEFDSRSSNGAYIWKTKRRAACAMRLACAELKSVQLGCPFPDWARKALAEGWKPPRRWRPTREVSV